MENQQDSTNGQITTTENPQTVELIDGVTYAQDQYIALVALGGMIPDPEGQKAAVRMTVTELAAELGYERTTLYAWRKSIPDFWDRVNRKRKELSGKDRISNVWNGLYLKGVAGDARAAAIYLANHDPDFVMPMQQVTHEVGNSWTALMEHREAEINNVIEGEIVSGPANTNQ